MASSNSAAPISFPGMLTILFVGLKLTGHIDWPWVWVLSPIWIVIALVVLIAMISALAD